MESMVKVDIVSWKDKRGGDIQKIGVDAFPYGYSVGPRGEWQMLVAAEDKAVRANEMTDIKVRDVEIPERAIILPCFAERHALGVVASVGGIGRSKLVEEKRKIDNVIFYPISDGKVHIGELLGVINILYATFERKLTEEAVESWLKGRSG
ncbi:MAG: DUF22 domain-containing protein [Candidatus Methanolliviera hydrocarbonicum]|uniref:DUF22 domain-containing protein n=1 Tax=Candidatus Methanolliviera hydrocarbonicum TaxID=2491085 RepID=A0A520KX99_9EURY|nr:MAG: DUF22 domain-containing protein [Candidatus Methanolliviera hydrocarbonicum]